MNDLAVVTAIYGGFDEIHESVEQDIEADWFVFTDDPDLKAPKPWQVVVDNGSSSPLPHRAKTRLHPAMAARKCKLLTPLPHRYVLWVDANMSFASPEVVRGVWDHLNDGLAVFTHPRRNCIYDEVEASLVGRESQNGKYASIPLREQAASYREQGHPECAGLYASGTIAWDRSKPGIQELSEQWWRECESWGSFHCQVSFPVVLRRLGIRPGIFPLDQLERYVRPCIGNRWILIHPHLK